MDLLKRAKEFRKVAMISAEGLTDAQAATVPTMYPEWSAGESVKVDDRRYYPITEKLYKCLQDHTTQADWTPDVTASLWVVVDVEHTGTLEDPISASVNMEYTEGLHYLDPEDNAVYLCDRSTGQAVSYLPHELVGTYFEVVSE